MIERQGSWVFGQDLDAHVAGAGVAMLLHSLGDRRLVAPHDEGVDQPIAAAVGDVVVGEPRRFQLFV